MIDEAKQVGKIFLHIYRPWPNRKILFMQRLGPLGNDFFLIFSFLCFLKPVSSPQMVHHCWFFRGSVQLSDTRPLFFSSFTTFSSDSTFFSSLLDFCCVNLSFFFVDVMPFITSTAFMNTVCFNNNMLVHMFLVCSCSVLFRHFIVCKG